MDGFTYHDIFQTKGLEYIIIIGFLLLLIPFWVIINKKAEIARQIRKVFGKLTADVLSIRKGIFYTRNHTWAFMEKSGEAKVGLDDLLLHITGEVQLRYLRNADEEIRKGDLLAELEQNGKLLKIVSPVSGQILRTNPVLIKEPGIMNSDPYDQGWLYKIRPNNWKEETKSYFLADEAVNWSKNELDRFKDFMAVSLGKCSPEPAMVILQEGGELSDNPLSGMPGEIWQDFQEEFLRTDG
jgi:glycine cleavage system H protein